MEAGCDEAGRGCFAGPVFAAAVILNPGFHHPFLNDSKKLTAQQREEIRPVIEREALAWAVASVDNEVIDSINILKASFRAMQLALRKLSPQPGLILVDGNRFTGYENIPHQCIIRGDGEYASIAAASILAKTHRDEFMINLHHEFPVYEWQKNKGYGTADHRKAILQHGLCRYHRRSFQLRPQPQIPFN